MEDIAGFDWDGGNLAKCQKHGVTIAEIESVFGRPVILLPDTGHSAREPRMRAIGKATSGRHVFVVFTMRAKGVDNLIRPVSARYMHRREVIRYEKDNPQVEKDPNVPH